MQTIPAWIIEPLTKVHERSAFCCGASSLDKFIQELATQYERRNLARTFVATLPPKSTVEGYYALAPGSVAFENMPAMSSRKLPQHPIPVVHLGRLAVNQQTSGQGLGRLLLLDALHRVWQLSKQTGIHAVEVHALDEIARRFYLKYGFAPLVDDHFHLYLPMKAITRLFAP